MKDKIILRDVIDGLQMVNTDTVALTVTSPPYCVGINYTDRDDNQPYQEYLDWLKKVFTEVYRATKPGGRCVINIDAMTNRQDDKDQEYTRCIYAHLYNLMKEIGWKFRTEIAWYKQNAVGRQTAWGSYASCSNPIVRRTHEYILVWSKGQWNLEGDSELSDMTKEEFCEYTLSTWFIPPETRNMGGHPVPFPEKLVERIIKLYSYRGDTVLDCFNGSGTTTYVAKALGRSYIGIDNSVDYCKYARERLDSADSLFEEEYVPRSKRLSLAKDKIAVEPQTDLFDEQ